MFPPPGWRGLGATDRAVLDALLPSGASDVLPLGVLDSGFETFIVEFRRDAAPALRRTFRLALFAAGWGSPILIGRLPPINRLPPLERERALAAMERSDFVIPRQLMLVLKTVVALHYGAVPAVRESIRHHQ